MADVGMDEAGDWDEGPEDIAQDDCWPVISSYFSEKGLVRQQLDRLCQLDARKPTIGPTRVAIT